MLKNHILMSYKDSSEWNKTLIYNIYDWRFWLTLNKLIEIRIMEYDNTWVSLPERSNYTLPYFAANIRTFETDIIQQDQLKAEDSNYEYSLTSKICKLTKNTFAKALDVSNFYLARKIVQEKKDLLEVTDLDAERLISMIARYENEEIIPLREE